MSDFLTELRSGRVLLMDGAMGTELQRLGPDRVVQIHSSYTAATADVLLTNTFQLNPTALAKRGLAGEHHALWQAAVHFARQAVPPARFILGDVGPVENCSNQIAANIVDECQALDGILLETWTSLDALEMFGQARGVAVLVSFTFHRNTQGELTTFENLGPEECAQASSRVGAVAIGANCGKEIDMADMLEIVKRYKSACDLPVFVRSNAGTPQWTTAGWSYPRSPEQMAAGVAALLQARIAMIGGCCGTTPAHIHAIRRAMTEFECERGF